MKKLAGVAAILMLLASCADPEGMFQNAEEDRSIDVYRQLISEFPNSDLVGRAKERIADIEAWNEADGRQEKGPYESYLETYPDGLFAGDATMQMQAIDAFGAVRDQDTLAAYRRFRDDYPDSIYDDEISRRTQELAQVEIAYEALKSETNPELFRSFLEKNPDNGYRKLAQERLLELLPEPRIDFVLDQSVTRNWPDDLLLGFRQVVASAVRVASIGMPVEHNQVYAHYDNGFGMGFDGNGRPYNWFSHELKIEVREDGGELTYEKTYKGSVPGAHRGSTFSTGNTAGIARGPVDYELVLSDVEKMLGDDPL